MAKAKISSKDFLDLLDEQNDQPAPAIGSFGRKSPTLPSHVPNSIAEHGHETGSKEVAELQPSSDAGQQSELKKQVANGYQTVSKETAKQVANSEQTGSKEVAEVQIGDAPLLGPKPKQVAQRVARPLANGKQTGSKEVAEASFEALVGKERALLLFIIEDCQINGDLKTGPLTLERISEVLGCGSNRAKNVLHRLTEKSFLYRAEAKTGRGGWTRFGVSKELFQKILLSETGSKGLANGYQTGSKEVAKRVAQQVAAVSSSSSSIDLQKLKTTTTGEPELFDDDRVQLSPDWVAVDFSPLVDVGFSRAHLLQLAKHGKLSAAEVQDSIHFFAFDLKQNGKGKEIKGAPVNFFMGILRKGLPYAPPENYESPETIARRQYLEGKRRIQEKREAQERELQALDFAEWRRGLTQEQVNELVPDVVLHIPRAREESLRSHHDENVWPERRHAIPAAAEAETAAIRREIEQSLGTANHEGSA